MNTLSTNFTNNVTINTAEIELIAAFEARKAKYPVPDINQMLPFKPIRNARKYILI